MNWISIGIFAVIMALTLWVTAWSSGRTRTASEFYTGGKGLTAAQNGFALAGDWCSAAAFLGFTGLTALFGMDGAFYAVGPLLAFCTVLLLIAEPLRNTGTYTMGDVILYRMRQPSALWASAVGAIIINLAYMIPQMAGGGVLIKLLFGLRYDVSVVLVGIGMILYVAIGGMLATSWVQIIKAVLMLGAGLIILVLALAGVNFNPLTLFESAEAKAGAAFMLPGNLLKNPWDELSLGLAIMLGLAGLPHVMTRFYTVPDAKTARKSVIWVMFLAGSFFFCTTIFGMAAVHYLGPQALRVGNPGGNLTLPLLAEFLGGGKGTLGGQIMVGFVSAVAVATILAVVAGLTLATSGTIANDIYVNLIMKGKVEEKSQVMVARLSSIGIGIFAIVLGILAEGVNVAILVFLAIGIAASTNFPVVALSIFWRRFTTAGVIGGVALGLVSALYLVLIGPAGKFYAGPEGWWQIANPTIVSLPLGILGAILGSLLGTRDMENEKRFDEVMFRTQTGIKSDV
ncbi:solute symporter family protein [Candidatus Raskinella chloraquaticus]|uniref:solute symporter family protein n=1 Tax=Candidatus Raskinella chloraquaticus TaxID=1951219 RepID=UPI00366D4C73